MAHQMICCSLIPWMHDAFLQCVTEYSLSECLRVFFFFPLDSNWWSKVVTQKSQGGLPRYRSLPT